MAFTSLVWPWEKSIWHTLETDYLISEINLFEVRFSTWNDFTGLSWFNWQTWICLSVEQEAKLSSDFLKQSCGEKRSLEDYQEVGIREYIYWPVHIESGGGVEGELLFAASCCCVPDYRCPANNHFCIFNWSSRSRTDLSTPALRMKFPVLFHFSAKIGPWQEDYDHNF